MTTSFSTLSLAFNVATHGCAQYQYHPILDNVNFHINIMKCRTCSICKLQHSVTSLIIPDS